MGLTKTVRFSNGFRCVGGQDPNAKGKSEWISSKVVIGLGMGWGGGLGDGKYVDCGRVYYWSVRLECVIWVCV